jgi:hypothetical protein
MIKKYIILLFLVALVLSSHLAEACNKLKIKQAHEWFFGIDYPYWYSVAQAKIESNCKWVTSLDGHESIGYLQITPKWFNEELKKAGFYQWQEKDHIDYYFSHAYILAKLHKQNKCRLLYITYQCYNRTCQKVIKENNSCSWEVGYQSCLQNDKQVCVLKKEDKCFQYRSSCDINYSYSKKIYQEGKKIEEWKSKWIFY